MEEGGGRLGVSAAAGFRALRGIPIELFLMCFNFHFLLLENTDGDLLPLTHTERGAHRESAMQQTRVRPSYNGIRRQQPSPEAAPDLSFPSCKMGLAEAVPKAPPGSTVWGGGSALERGRRLQLNTGSKGCPV